MFYRRIVLDMLMVSPELKHSPLLVLEHVTGLSRLVFTLQGLACRNRLRLHSVKWLETISLVKKRRKCTI